MLRDALSLEIYLTKEKSSHHSGSPAVLLMPKSSLKSKENRTSYSQCQVKVFLLSTLILDLRPSLPLQN